MNPYYKIPPNYAKSRWAELTNAPTFDTRRTEPPVFDRRRGRGNRHSNLKLINNKIYYEENND